MPQADISVTVDDEREFVQVGDVIDYVVTVQNAGPNDAFVAVLGNFLPLQDASWTCTATGGATCAGGTGNLLTDVPSVPVGGAIVYTLSGTLSSMPVSPETIVGWVQVTLSDGNMVDPQAGNNTATDTDSVVVFRNGFDDGSPVFVLDDHPGASGFVAADLALDPILVDGLGAAHTAQELRAAQLVDHAPCLVVAERRHPE
jgi:uncharacterized repeat protein (TIGR01451 family)